MVAHHVRAHHPGRARRHRGAAHHPPVQGQPRIHGRHRGEVRHLIPLRTRHAPGTGPGRRNRPPLPLRAGGAPVGRQADAAGPRRRGRRALADLRLRRQVRQLQPGLGDPPACGLAGERPGLTGGEAHAKGRGHRRHHRRARRVPADLRPARLRAHALAPQAQDRPARPAGPREDLLRRPQRRGRHLRHARD
ncbi:hypothetical protein D9M69_567130 [compost metagenome]